MAKSSRDEFSAKTKRDLAARAGHLCSFPDCGRPTSGPGAEAPHASVNLAEACHIRAAASGAGARRYDPSMTSAERSSIDNGVWMCRTHANLIDSDEGTYTVEELQRLKEQADWPSCEPTTAALSRTAPGAGSSASWNRRCWRSPLGSPGDRRRSAVATCPSRATACRPDPAASRQRASASSP